MLRDFRQADQRAVRDLVQRGLGERWGDAFDPSFNSDLDDITTNYVHGGSDVVVLDIDDEIVACGMLVPEDQTRARIVRMSVSNEMRRRGLARQIVEELVARARARGLAQVLVSTDTPWTSAVALYESCGFVERHRDETDTHFVMALSRDDENQAF